MGNNNSNLNSINVTSREIIKLIEELIDEYKFWDDTSICFKLEKILPKKIIEFNKFNKITSYGIKFQNGFSDEERSKICKEIINHYKKRLLLMEFILNQINKSIEILNNLHNGSVCGNTTRYINTFKECEKYEGIWINKNKWKELKKSIKGTVLINKWNNALEELYGKYKKNLNYLKKVILKLKNDISKNEISDSDFVVLENIAIIRSKRLIYICEIYYLLGVNLHLL